MSRGHGSLQRKIIAYLDACPRRHSQGYGNHWRECAWPPWTVVHYLAGRLYAPDDPDPYVTPTRSQVEATRQAVQRLRAEGLAELGYVPRETSITVRVPRNERYLTWDGCRAVDGLRRFLAVRPVLTDAERAAEQADQDAQRRWTDAMTRLALRG